jgi:hypothetical protein
VVKWRLMSQIRLALFKKIKVRKKVPYSMLRRRKDLKK